MLWFEVLLVKCPFCLTHKTKVVDKRDSSEKVRRRRECLICSKRFTTYERADISGINVIKRNKKREPFNSDKVFLSLVKACAKRDVEQKKIDRIVNDIELKIRNMDLNEVKSSTIGNMILEHLLKLDKIAHLRFASVYKEFNTLRDFEKEITHLRKTRAGVKKRPKK